ncbi:MAG TPA: 3-oxoacyl-[acyl-carrier-protein] reductase [Spirochaetota bacterium]|jgi:3-oxoacyl-[acyl-carrier protein] reductase|nr:3-oxoacyl-[acyl-carrier-protein] reductase [Spirochaetota bacterium]HOR45881.1 3-oxoacyl-[acyl-carrier-protein] reductase [Spirochaetota bacterium]HOU84406.1 3-oxoacyl-[acyl-carrier-protein] reductase [Spirochaetota bacterium]HPK57603.1 3-oxoacyl-[acyl-carrier-protein] reductase [Spirochaetota bacterium]HQQ23478.1 3-oxoacyl-[acyl-carrier-protein] reductase [Spirochaetota bacterium]
MLKGKTAVITGGARGIGKSIAVKYAQNGANIVISDMASPEQMQEVVKELEAFGVKAKAFQSDVTDYDAVKKLLDDVVAEFGSLDIVVNNAGITKDMPIIAMKEKDYMDVINVNQKGVFNMLKHASVIMLKQKSGRIINMASVVGVMGNAGQVNYSASKAAVIGMTKSVAKELSSRGITCNAIAPGFIQSAMTDKLNDAQKNAMLSMIPLKKFGQPEDVANTALFLASELSSYLTGQVICVDGGMIM